MQRIVIFGNSGSGKSTLAKELAREHELAHLDLDLTAWKPTSPPERKPVSESWEDIRAFMASNAHWVIEGCYSDLLETVVLHASEIIFLNLPVELCIANARNRPWEPHKYESREAQDANLDMLIEWIAQYDERDDTFSKSAHEALFESYDGKKTLYKSNRKR